MPWMQAKKAVKQKKKVVHLDSDADDMSMDDDDEDSDFDGAPKKVPLPSLLHPCILLLDLCLCIVNCINSTTICSTGINLGTTG